MTIREAAHDPTGRPAARLPVGPARAVRRRSHARTPTASSTSRSARPVDPVPGRRCRRRWPRRRDCAGLPAHRGHARAARGDQRVGRAHAARRRSTRPRCCRPSAPRSSSRCCRCCSGSAPATPSWCPELAYPTYDVGARVAGCRGRGVRLHARARPAAGVAGLGQLAVEPDRAGAAGRAPRARWSRGPASAARSWSSDECYLELGWDADAGLGPRPARERRLATTGSCSPCTRCRSGRTWPATAPGSCSATRRSSGSLLEARKHLGLMVPAPVQAAMVAALGDDAHVAEQRERYARRRDHLLSALLERRLHASSTPRPASTCGPRATSRAGTPSPGSPSAASSWRRASSTASPVRGTCGSRSRRPTSASPPPYAAWPGGLTAQTGPSRVEHQHAAVNAARRRSSRGRRRRARDCRRRRSLAGLGGASAGDAAAIAPAVGTPRHPGWSSATTQQARTSDSRTTEADVSDVTLSYPGGELPLARVPATVGSDGLDISTLLKTTERRDPRRRVHQHRVVHVGDHLHRRRRGHPALPRLPDRAARGAVDLPRDVVPAHLRRAADAPTELADFESAHQAAHDAARGPAPVLRRLPARRAPDAGAVAPRSARCRPSTRTRSTRSTPSRSRSPPSGCSPSCRRSRRTPTRSPSGSPSSTPTTR